MRLACFESHQAFGLVARRCKEGHEPLQRWDEAETGRNSCAGPSRGPGTKGFDTVLTS